MSNPTMASLFSGSGGFELASVMCGIEPVWASEIEKFPIAVTTKRFPYLKHLGDITKINGAEVEPVDVITFGSPCQNMSISGNGEGLSGSQSCLFYEAIRIIKEMRSATNGRYPTYAVWENVPGAFSSNKGEDFHKVITEMCKIKDPNVSIPRPNKRKGNNAGLEWKDCGAIMGNDYSIAWRCLSAEFWGVPQRRKRIFLVADFRGQRAAEILVKREGNTRYFTQGKTPWQGAAATAENGVGTASKDIMIVENHPADSRVNLSNDGAVQTLTSRIGTGGGNVPMVMQKTLCFDETQITSPTNANKPTIQRPLPYYKRYSRPPTICIAGNTIDRQPQNGGNGVGCQDDISYTLNTVDRHAVAYEQQAYDKYIETDVSATLKAGGGNYGGGSETLIAEKLYSWIVRRLLPTECASLQGFPKWWCADVPHSDSAEYKMWGNGVALPCVLYIMEGIAEELRKENQ